MQGLSAGAGALVQVRTARSGAYVFVADHYHLAGRESGIISSATVGGVEQITEFLKTSHLRPCPIKVLEPGK